MAYLNVNNLNNTLDILYNQDASNDRYKLKILFGETELENVDDYCEELVVTDRIIPNGSKQFMLNSLISKEVDLTLHDVNAQNLNGQVNISIGILVDEEAEQDEDRYEYIPIGIFNIDGEPTTNTGKTTFKLRDNSILLDYPYNAKPLIDENGGKVTKLQIFQDICEKFNIETDIDNFDNSGDEIGIYDNTITARTYISYLAEQCGCIPKFDRNGKLIFIDILNLYTWEIPFEYFESYENGDSYTISKVIYEDAIRHFEYGNDDNDKMFLDSANPYISSQEQVENIGNKVLGFSINSLKTGKIKGNPLIDAYDIIQFTNDNQEIFKTLATYQFRYNGVLRNTFETEIGLEEREQNVTISGEPTFRKYAKTNIDNINNNITMIVAEQDEQSERITRVQQDVNSIQNLFQITGGSNLIKDSQLLLKDEGLWEYGQKGNYSFFPSSSKYPMSTRNPIEYYYREPTYIGGYDSTLIGKTVAIAKIGISNGMMSSSYSNITGLIIGNMYTLSYKITNEANTNSKIKLIGNGNVVYEETFDSYTKFEEKVFSFVAQTSNYKIEIQTTSTTDGFTYIYDLMLNKGDVQTWQPASGEIVSTIIKLSQLGVQVFSSSEEIATLMTSQGFEVVRYSNGTLYEVITKFTKDGLESKKGKLETLEIGNYDFKTLTYQGFETLVLYKKESGN